MERDKLDLFSSVWEAQASKSRSSPPEGEPTSYKVKVKPVMPETEKKQPSRGSDRGSSSGVKSEDRPPTADPGARQGVPLVTVEVIPETKSDVQDVRDGIVALWIAAKVKVVEVSDKIASFLGLYSLYGYVFGP